MLKGTVLLLAAMFLMAFSIAIVSAGGGDRLSVSTRVRALAPQMTRVKAINRGEIIGFAKDGKLKGHVKNAANGVAVRNLKIEVVGQGEAVTDQNGEYHFDSLPAGLYKLLIKSSQFDPHSRTITIHSGQTTISNFNVIPLSAPRPRR